MTLAWRPDSKGATITEPLGALWVERLKSPRVTLFRKPYPQGPWKKVECKIGIVLLPPGVGIC